MKKRIAVVAIVSSACLFASRGAAAETVEATIVKVDDVARTVTFRKERADKEEVAQVDRAVDLKSVRTSVKARITIDDGVVKDIKAVAAKPRAPGY